jgi:hypothetical protein
MRFWRIMDIIMLPYINMCVSQFTTVTCDVRKTSIIIMQMQWRTQEIAKGAGHFRGHEKLTTFFWETTKGGGVICPSTCFLVFFKPSKIIFRQPKGGGGPWTPGPPPLGTPLCRCLQKLYSFLYSILPNKDTTQLQPSPASFSGKMPPLGAFRGITDSIELANGSDLAKRIELRP